MSQKKSMKVLDASILPQRSERLNDEALGERGFLAESFEQSAEHDYLVGLLQRMMDARKWDKLNLGGGQAAELQRVCVELDMLDEVMLGVRRDINVGRAAREREAKRRDDNPLGA